jgi:tetratricopeptide (TPR) repeat protein
MIEEALAIATRTGDRRRAARLEHNLAQVLAHLDDPKAAAAFDKTAHRALLDVGDVQIASWAVNGEGNALFALGDYDGAADAYREAARLAKEAHAPEDAALALNNLAGVCFERGRMTEGRAQAEEAYAQFASFGSKYGQGIALSQMATASLYLGDLARAEDEVRRSIDALANERSDAAVERVQLGTILDRRGDREGALRAYRDAEQTQTELHQKGRARHTAIAIAGVVLEGGGVAEAEAEAERALADSASANDATGVAVASAVLARVAAERKDATGARAHLARAAAGYAKLDLETRETVARAHADVLASLGDKAGAQSWRARAVFR